jgi:hypothetical protein
MDEPRKSSKTPLALVVGLVLLVLLCLYVLSIGPVSLLVDRGYLGEEWVPVVKTLYAPLYWLIKHSKVCEVIFQWYMGLFGYRF